MSVSRLSSQLGQTSFGNLRLPKTITTTPMIKTAINSLLFETAAAYQNSNTTGRNTKVNWRLRLRKEEAIAAKALRRSLVSVFTGLNCRSKACCAKWSNQRAFVLLEHQMSEA
jgi:hypothetical protein